MVFSILVFVVFWGAGKRLHPVSVVNHVDTIYGVCDAFKTLPVVYLLDLRINLVHTRIVAGRGTISRFESSS